MRNRQLRKGNGQGNGPHNGTGPRAKQGLCDKAGKTPNRTIRHGRGR